MSHPAFERIRSESIPSLKLTLEEYKHKETGARHFHLASDDNNNCFLVGFLTVPQDSTGVAHILEHTSLCGSARFPVRDPFFMMSRRSLNTFMNAFTSSDWTAYPFASQNEKDFNNLLQVFLDAVFHPCLDALDFAQEGHRMEFAEPGDASSELIYKGVVYNEMKGAMSSPARQAYDKFYYHLFPSTTYHYNSGGDPEDIPELTHAQLKAFHARHYHPSNAVFMTYGDTPAQTHQARFQEWALASFQAQPQDIGIPDEQRLTDPIAVEECYTLEPSEDPKQKTQIILGWLLGKGADLSEAMDARLLSSVLLDNSASPLRKALETSSLGTAPSELCGWDDSTRETVFMAGLEGSEPEQADAVEALILEVLRDVAENGLPTAQLESVLHQMELHQREITGGGFPYGLQLMVNLLSPIQHGGDPVAYLAIDPVLEKLRERIQDPEYIKGLVCRLLLDNSHRVRLVMRPDGELEGRREAAEKVRLAEYKAKLDEAGVAHILQQASALKERQLAEDDPNILPKVGLEDVSDELKIASGESQSFEGMPVDWFTAGTNGMVYQQLVCELPAIPAELQDLLPLYCTCLTEVGIGDWDYLQTQTQQAAISGGIGTRVSYRSEIGDVQKLQTSLILSGKALARNRDALGDLLHTTFERPRFDERTRLRELVAQVRAIQESSASDHGHVLAMTAASAGLAPAGGLAHRWGGLQGMKALKALEEALKEEPAMDTFIDRLQQLHRLVQQAQRALLLIGEAPQRETWLQTLQAQWPNGHPSSDSTFQPAWQATTVNQAWTINAQVNFCAQAYPCVSPGHADAPVLTVLGRFLVNGFLHTAVREQGGAYGSGAAYDPDSGSFRLYSYRDPRLAGTLQDFQRALDWLQQHKHSAASLEEAILGVVSAIDRPDSPAGEASSAYHAARSGRSPEFRRNFRSQVLAVGLADLQRVGAQYLQSATPHTAVVGSKAGLSGYEELGLEACSL